MISKK